MMKAPNLNETTMQLLMNPADQRDLTQHISDPVEMRRLNYQTPGKEIFQVLFQTFSQNISSDFP